jgi:RNA polymerase sigma factor (sigma-70 family)
MKQRLPIANAAGRAITDEEFEGIYLAHCDLIRRYLFRRVLSWPTAEDLVAETFLKAWLRMDQYDERGTMAHWLIRLARNVVIDWARREHRYATCELSPFDAEVPAPIDDEAVAVREAMLELPDLQCEVIRLVMAEGLNDIEIAARLNSRPGAVRAAKFRATATLRARFAYLSEAKEEYRWRAWTMRLQSSGGQSRRLSH